MRVVGGVGVEEADADAVDFKGVGIVLLAEGFAGEEVGDAGNPGGAGGPFGEVGGRVDIGGEGAAEVVDEGIGAGEIAGAAEAVFPVVEGGEEGFVFFEGGMAEIEFGGEEAVAQENFAGGVWINPAVVNAFALAEGELSEGDALLGFGETAFGVPDGAFVVVFAEVGGDGFDPFGIEEGAFAGEEAGGLEEGEGHDPFWGLSAEGATGEDVEGLSPGGAEEVVFLALTDHAGHAGEEGAVESVGVGEVHFADGGGESPVVISAGFAEVVDKVDPFLNAAGVQKVCGAEFAAGGAGGAMLADGVPEVDDAEEVGGGIFPEAVGAVGGLGFVGRAFAGVLNGEEHGGDEDGGEDIFVVALLEHAGEAGFEGEGGEDAAAGGEFAAVGHGADFVEGAVALGDEGAFGGVDEGEVGERGQAEDGHAEDDFGEGAAADFGVGVGGSVAEGFFGIEADADAGAGASAAAAALEGGGAGDLFGDEALDLRLGVHAVDADFAGVDDGADAGEGDGGFGDVGGENDAAASAGGEDFLLVLEAEAGEEGEDFGVTPVVALELFGGVADFALAGEEDEGVEGAVVAVELLEGFENAVLDVAAVVGTFGKEEILNGIEAAFDREDGGVVEEGGEAFGVEGGGGNDDFEVGAAAAEVAEAAEDEVDVEAALVGFVDDEGVVGEPVGIVGELGEEHAVGHELDAGAFGGAVLEADLNADGFAESGLAFFGDAPGHAGGGEAAGLGDADFAEVAAAGLEDHLGELGGFAGAGVAADDDHGMVAEGLEDAFALAADGKLFRIVQGGNGGVEGVEAFRGVVQRVFPLVEGAVHRLLTPHPVRQAVQSARQNVPVAGKQIRRAQAVITGDQKRWRGFHVLSPNRKRSGFNPEGETGFVSTFSQRHGDTE